jgi:soluble lytic murein transglycosylase-like protein
MRKFAFFVSLAVGAAVAWEISRQKPAERSAEPMPEGIGGVSLDVSGVVDTTPAPCTFCAAVNAVVEPIKDAVVTVTRSVFGTPYDALINSSAVANGLPPETLYKLLYAESRFRPDIIEGRTKSPVGALGIAQFMPATAVEWLGSAEAALDPQKAIPGAARYLAWLRHRFNGDLKKAVAAYNWGIGNVQRKGLTSAPKETQNYVLNILGEKIA